MRRSLLAVFLLVAGCASGAPATTTPSPAGASPSAQPTTAPTATAAPTATYAPTAAASPTSGASAGYGCDPDTGYGCDYSTPPGATAAPSPQGEVVVITQSSGPVPHFLGPSGHALYVFDNDSPTQSACDSGCTDIWPPLMVALGTSVQAGGEEAGFATLTRDDGSLQLTYDQRPLYYYSGDSSGTDTNGDGLFGVWHLAQP